MEARTGRFNHAGEVRRAIDVDAKEAGGKSLACFIAAVFFHPGFFGKPRVHLGRINTGLAIEGDGGFVRVHGPATVGTKHALEPPIVSGNPNAVDVIGQPTDFGGQRDQRIEVRGEILHRTTGALHEFRVGVNDEVRSGGSNGVLFAFVLPQRAKRRRVPFGLEHLGIANETVKADGQAACFKNAPAVESHESDIGKLIGDCVA